MSIKNSLLAIFLCFLAISVISVIYGLISINFQQKVYSAAENKNLSYRLSQELRMSSEDLTRLARTYVVSKDSAYEDMYWKILDVRNGKVERPDGTKIALKDKMKAAGFTDDEFQKLKEAEQNSNDLVTTETIAMNAIKGQFQDSNGGYTKKAEPDQQMAIRIMHDKKYHQDKDKIMKPIDEFDKLMEKRVDDTLQNISKSSITATIIFISAVVIFTIIASAFILISSQKILKKLFDIVTNIHQVFNKNKQINMQFFKNIEEVINISKSQDASIQSTLTSFGNVKGSVQKMNEEFNTAKKMTDEIEKSTINGKSSMERMLSASEKIQEINTNMQKINQVILEISKKALVINEIVSKTELLSLNASIESARAGEHGKGFAVVAEEVGNLAKVTGKSAMEIEELITRSINEVTEIISITNEKTKESKKVADDTNIIFNVIAEKIAEIINIINASSHSSELQYGEVEQNFLEISNMQKLVDGIRSISSNISTLSEELKNNNQELEKYIEFSYSFIQDKKSA